MTRCRFLTAAGVLGLLASSAAAAPAAPDPAAQEKARDILASAGLRGGLIVHLGCGDGCLTAALRAGDAWLVHGLDADPANVAAARAHLQSLDLYGPVSVERWTGARLPYADNLVNLLVADDLGGVPMAEVMRVLAPRGVACLRDGAAWKTTVKPWPEGLDEWTHWLHDAAGNAVARDRAVGPPRRIQWVEGPLWARHHELNTSVPALVSAKGRVFYACDEAPATAAGLPDQWALVARDAFNGLLLWKRPIPDWGWKAWSLRETGGRFNLPLLIARRLVAVGDRVYVTLGFNAPVTALDAATGEVLKTYDGTASTDEILWRDGLLVLSVNKGPQKPGLMAEAPPVRKQVVAVKADSGEVLWRQGDYAGIATMSNFMERITHLVLAVGNGYVALVEEDAVVALDLATGRPLWRTPRPQRNETQGHVPYKPPNLCTLVACDDIVLFAQPEEPYTRQTWNRGVRVRMVALSARTGQVLWTQACSKWGPGLAADVFVVGPLVWTCAAAESAAIGMDLKTGQIERKVPAAIVFNEAHHHRCYRNKATERYMLTARRGIEFIDLEAGRCETNHWVRGACRFGIMPCNGLVYVPPHACQCYIADKLSGFYALAPAAASPGAAAAGPGAAAAGLGAAAAGPGTAAISPGAGGNPFEKGPAFGEISDLKSEIRDADDWPTYRHDTRRSGATASPLAALDLKPLWRADLGTDPSACTVADGKVFAAAVAQHRLAALDARDGRLLWSHVAGGRIDTPPTVHKGLVLFGAADGWVYALRAADGAMAWRLRAAPDDRRIVAFGRLESAWPVHGTVLVQDGTAYVAAGRSGHLDGGIRVLALKPETGEVIRALKADEGLEDVLVAAAGQVYMRQLAIRPASDGPAAGAQGKGLRAAQPRRAFSTAGLLDDSDFSRAGWSAGAKGGLAHLMVFNEEASYAYQTRRTGGFGGWYEPGTGAYRVTASGAGAGKAGWSVAVPMAVRAMAAAGPAIVVAGTPDVVDRADPWGALEGRRGGLLRVLAAADGATLAERRLDAPPVWDGLAAAGGRLYLSLEDGSILCLGKP